ncbi:MAG: UDP-N-acetylmuramoyl-L-alanine--D-glutamate ligase [Phycisphaeraceae bacterium]|nr:MAG: UDP-N-acetylmuramoyl-L-alanine--D-glutamate ligase [Phycisphaeraceae bacterium]
MRVTIMGLGRFGGGLGVTRGLVEQGADVLVTDTASEDALAEPLGMLRGLIDSGQVQLRLGGHNVADFTDTELVVANPAVPRPWENRYLRAAAAAGVPITTEIRMAVEQLNRDRVIGVTGSAGKSTTSAMIHHLLGSVGVRSYLGGNIGGSVLDGLDEACASEWVVLELSSAMLYWLGAGVGSEGDAAWSPGVGVLTNVMPNHIDWHGSYEHYRACKARIAEGDGVVVYCAEDGAGGLAELVAGKRKSIGVSQSDADEELTSSLRLPGEHNRLNAAIARATVEACTGHRTAAFEGFRGLAHRLEFVGEFSGVRVYNDSKSTTPEACALAVGAFEQEGTHRIHLICGGYDKGVDLGGMVRAAAGCASVATIGATGERLAREIRSAGGQAEFVQTLEKAAAWVGGRTKPGEIVLLSPGCASWDQFAHFEERGCRFVSLIQGILKPD